MPGAFEILQIAGLEQLSPAQVEYGEVKLLFGGIGDRELSPAGVWIDPQAR